MSQPPGYESGTPMPKRETPGIAIASLVCGILSWVCAGPLAAIPAVITGHLALGRIKRSAGAPGFVELSAFSIVDSARGDCILAFRPLKVGWSCQEGEMPCTAELAARK